MNSIPEDCASLQKMIALDPEHIVPSHTRPVLGGAAAHAALTAYRNGIQSILEGTLGILWFSADILLTKIITRSHLA